MTGRQGSFSQPAAAAMKFDLSDDGFNQQRWQLAYKRNSIGPMIEPWGTPEVTGSALEDTPNAVNL